MFMTAAPASWSSLTILARCLPTAPIAARTSQRRSRARGGVARVAPTHYRGREGDEAAAEAFAARVKAIQRIRSRIEKIFGTWKRSYGLRRMRWRGIAKAALQVRLTAIAYNLRRGLTLLVPA
jgi:transposase, IS5 family